MCLRFQSGLEGRSYYLLPLLLLEELPRLLPEEELPLLPLLELPLLPEDELPAMFILRLLSLLVLFFPLSLLLPLLRPLLWLDPDP
jgi:hypothetical protein